VALDEYWLVNVAASYELSPGVALYGRIQNALDEDYQEVFGFETAGVAAYAGLRFSYEEQASVAWANRR
jgi:vitamin B12 transporter